MYSLLSLHRATLKTICISYLGSHPDPTQKLTFDTASFPELTTFGLHSWNLTCTPDIACSTVIGSNVRTFIYDLNDTVGGIASFRFHKGYADWISKLRELAAARNSALRTIEISFNRTPKMMPNSWAEYDEYGYPRDCMDDAKSRLVMLGGILKFISGAIHQ